MTTTVSAQDAPQHLQNDDGHNPSQPRRTPLPKFQLFIVFLIQFAEPITATVIYPFINQFVRDTGVTGGDERKTGYYAGIIESSFFFAEALTVFQWGRASDRFGRRPVLLLGPLGLSLAMLGFGLSKKYWSLVLSRCMQGVFNGNIGVSKSVMGEITDSTNIADAFAMMPLMWTFGSTIGPILGGILSQPAQSWPGLFGRVAFYREYPYFLPCAVASSIACVSALIASVGLRETLPSAVLERKKKISAVNPTPDSTTSLLTSATDSNYGSTMVNRPDSEINSPVGTVEVPPPLSSLFTPRVLLTLLVYAFLAFIDMSCQVLLPLVYSTSIPFGGLGFDPYLIGSIMGTWGAINAVIQLTFLGRTIRRFGPANLLIFALSSYAVVLSLYPLLGFLVKRAGKVNGPVWAVICTQLIFCIPNNAAYASIQILILNSAPNSASLGATNGMAQAVGSAMRSVAPSIASSLFSISLERQLVGGNMIYIILIGFALTGVRLGFLLLKA